MIREPRIDKNTRYTTRNSNSSDILFSMYVNDLLTLDIAHY